jgi:hypothetical protein
MRALQQHLHHRAVSLGKRWPSQGRPANRPSGPCGLLLKGRGLSEMAHKYKIGAVVHYNPGQKSVRALGKRYTIIAFMPKTKGEPTYEIKHDNGDKRVARESELRQV